MEAAEWPIRTACRHREGSLKALRFSRVLYQCVDCLRRETLTAGTVLEGTHLDLSTWFAAAERQITRQAVSRGTYAPRVQDVARQMGCGLTAARRVRPRLQQDLRPSRSGLLRRAICIEIVSVPDGVLEGGPDYLASIEEEVEAKLQRGLLMKESRPDGLTLPQSELI